MNWRNALLHPFGRKKNVSLSRRPAQVTEFEKAKSAQERAISERTRTSSVVIIEEEYLSTGDAQVGIGGNKNGMQMGLNGSGKRLSKRKITFLK
jgi:hypothetical protein